MAESWEAAASMTRTLHPEIMLIGDNTRSRLAWTLLQETDRLDALLTEQPEMRQVMAENGWTTRMLAWGHVLAGFLSVLEFDDEKGRT